MAWPGPRGLAGGQRATEGDLGISSAQQRVGNVNPGCGVGADGLD